jgi:carboxylesterase type B
VVGLHYRLNLFAFGDGKGTAETNLGLKDQRVALDWVRKYIAGFGGDPVSLSIRGHVAEADI